MPEDRTQQAGTSSEKETKLKLSRRKIMSAISSSAVGAALLGSSADVAKADHGNFTRKQGVSHVSDSVIGSDGYFSVTTGTALGYTETFHDSDSGNHYHKLHLATDAVVEWADDTKCKNLLSHHFRIDGSDAEIKIDPESSPAPGVSHSKYDSDSTENYETLHEYAIGLMPGLGFAYSTLDAAAAFVDLLSEDQTADYTYAFDYNREDAGDKIPNAAKHQIHFEIPFFEDTHTPGWITVWGEAVAKDEVSTNSTVSSQNIEIFVDKNDVEMYPERSVRIPTFQLEAENNEFDDPWATHSLSNSWDDGVVIAKPLGFAGSDPCHTRLRNIDLSSSPSFEARVEEWEYLNGVHYPEEVSHLSIGTGVKMVESGVPLEVGKVQTDESWADVEFSNWFQNRIKDDSSMAAPIVIAQSQTYNGPNPIVTRLRDVSESGFQVRLQEEEASGGHNNETIGYIAIEPGDGYIGGTKYEAYTTRLDSGLTNLSFINSYNNPAFIAGVQSYEGDDPCSLRRNSLTGDYVDLFVEEEESADSETNHTEETIGYMVFEQKTA